MAPTPRPPREKRARAHLFTGRRWVARGVELKQELGEGGVVAGSIEERVENVTQQGVMLAKLVVSLLFIKVTCGQVDREIGALCLVETNRKRRIGRGVRGGGGVAGLDQVPAEGPLVERRCVHRRATAGLKATRARATEGGRARTRLRTRTRRRNRTQP